MISLQEQRALLDYYYRSFAPDIGLASNVDLSGTRLSEADPLTLLDLTLKPLFYDFDILDANGRKAGVVRSSARGAEFPMLDAIMIGKQYADPQEASQRASAQAAQDYSGATIGQVCLVCYGYPRVGALVPVDAAGKRLSVLYDAISGHLVRTWEGEYSSPEAGPGQEEPEGEPVYSLLERLPESGDRSLLQRHWSRAIAFFERTAPSRMAEALAGADAASAVPQPAVRGALLPVPLIGQATPVFCAVATAKMMLEYLGFKGHSQEEIAEVMQTGPDGTLNPALIAGFKKITNGRWRGRLDSAPTFERATRYLAAALPAKTGIPQHARLLRGWREYLFLDPSTGTIAHTEQFYIINDPYPVNSGQMVLECVVKPIGSYYRNILYLEPGPPPGQ